MFSFLVGWMSELHCIQCRLTGCFSTLMFSIPVPLIHWEWTRVREEASSAVQLVQGKIFIYSNKYSSTRHSRLVFFSAVASFWYTLKGCRGHKSSPGLGCCKCELSSVNQSCRVSWCDGSSRCRPRPATLNITHLMYTGNNSPAERCFSREQWYTEQKKENE